MHPIGFQSYNIIELLQNEYLRSLGSAYDTIDGYVRIEANAVARTLAQIWADVQRTRAATLPTSTFALESWETAFGISVADDVSDQQRRINLGLAWLRINLPARLGNILTAMNNIFGATLFAGYRITTQAQSVADGTASIPGGGGSTGGSTYPAGDWRSAAAHIAIELNYLTPAVNGYEGQVSSLIDQAYLFLDSILPAWVQFTFIRGTFALTTFPNLDNGQLG